VVLILDATQGYFREASWVSNPVEYLLMDKQQAIGLVLEKCQNQPEVIEAEMVSEVERMPCCPYYPFWRIVTERETWLVTQSGEAILASLSNVNWDDKVNVLDMIVIGQHWQETGSPGWIPADAKQDGLVDVLDMIVVGQDWTG